jgi:hypothetical protein
MPLFKAAIHKTTMGGPPLADWRNVYWVEDTGPDEALIVAESIANAEAAFHSTSCKFTRAVITSPTHTFNQRVHEFTSLVGERAVTEGDIVPLWNVANVLFEPSDFGRPERKYYRVQITRAEFSGYSLTTTLHDLIQSTMDSLVSSTPQLSNPKGTSILSATVESLVGMRQESWHRRSRPGFHRGYVPNT